MAEPIATPDTLAIYIHWPFCRSLCPYCDFNSHIGEQVDHARWRRALLEELTHYAELAGPRRVTSLFFGGGTPSLMEPETAAAVIDLAGQHFALDADAEITLEANPTSVEADRLAAFAAAGVNRVSLGIQSLDDDALKFLGRTHSAAEAIAAIEIAADTFDRYSFDLIYGRPGQSPEQWQSELAEAVALARGHLSVYQLTIEKGTPFFLAAARGDLRLPDEKTAGALFEATQEELAHAGLPGYEISNHAAPNQECRHNLAYWQYRDYLGVGPGSHGRLTMNGEIFATRQHRAPDIWLQRAGDHGHATQTQSPLSRDDAVAEMVLMGLRLTEGLHGENLRRRTGHSFDTAFDMAALDRLSGGGFIERTDNSIRATAAGRQRLDAVIGELLG